MSPIRMRILFVLAAVVTPLGQAVAIAETPYDLAWIHQFGGSSSEGASGVSADNLGNLYVSGYTYNSLGEPKAGGYTDAFLSKYDSQGNSLWILQIGSSGSDIARGVSVDSMGNVYISGRTTGSLGGPNAGSGDVFLSKYDSAGNLLWTSQFGTTMNDLGFGVSADGMGNVYISGHTAGSLAGPHQGGFDVFVRKYSTAGAVLWTRQLGTTDFEQCYAISADGLGNVYISGQASGSLGGPNAGSVDVFLCKYDSEGNLLWTRQFGTTEYENNEALSADGMGNVYISGTTFGSLGGPNAGSGDVFVSKYDSEGNRLWTRQLGTTLGDGSYAVSADGTGNVYISGGTTGSLGGPSAGREDAFVSKYDSEGNLLWTRQFGSSFEDEPHGMSIDGRGNVYVSGMTFGSLGGPSAGPTDVFVARLIPPPSWFVDASATDGANNGTNWADAFLDLQDALNAAGPYERIWVAQGTYYPTAQVGGTGERYRTFQMKNGVEIYGGFPNTGDPNFEERDPNRYETVLSGDIGMPGDHNDNCYHVFYHPSDTGLDFSAILDSFTIIAGNANGADPHNLGAGMYNDSANPVLTKCTFTENSANDGGGMYNYASSPTLTACSFDRNVGLHDGGAICNLSAANPRLTDCAFTGNSAGHQGGAIHNLDNCKPDLMNCTFAGNSAASGGAIYNENVSSPTIFNCVFRANSAENTAGAIRNDNGSNPILANCVLSGNISKTQYGGAVANLISNPTFDNCTFAGNSAYDYGGGVYNDDSDPNVIDCILWANTAPNSPQIHNAGSSSPTIAYSDIQDDVPRDGDIYPGTGNIDADPCFVDAKGADGFIGTEDDNLHLLSYSPCINAGKPSGGFSSGTDIDGGLRVRYGFVDMGADEVFPIAGDCEPDEDIDGDDLKYLADRWLNAPCAAPDWCEGADIDEGNTVDSLDFTYLGNNWAQSTAPLTLHSWLAAHFKLDESSGTIAENSIAWNHGTLHGSGIWRPTAGRVDGAIELDGTSGYISTGFVLDPAHWRGFSAAAWII